MHVEYRHDRNIPTAVKLVSDNIEIPDIFSPLYKKKEQTTERRLYKKKQRERKDSLLLYKILSE